MVFIKTPACGHSLPSQAYTNHALQPKKLARAVCEERGGIDGHSAFSINSFVLAMQHILSQKGQCTPRFSPMRSVFSRLLPRLTLAA